jgi:hypothetical protein
VVSAIGDGDGAAAAEAAAAEAIALGSVVGSDVEGLQAAMARTAMSPAAEADKTTGRRRAWRGMWLIIDSILPGD